MSNKKPERIESEKFETDSGNVNKREVGIWYSTWYSKLDRDISGYSASDNQHNIWKAWNIPYLPLGPSGEYETHDSLDEDVLFFHIDEITKAGIDFILMDQTNHIDVNKGFINARSIKMAQTIKKWNDNPNNRNRHLRYSSAIGEFQFSKDPASIEKEARMLYERYLAKDFGSPKYHYHLDGKPLMVVYAGNSNISLWEKYTGRKEFSDKFTIRWANNDNVPGYYGWAYDQGNGYHEEVMVVMPGWRNAYGGHVARRSGDWYRDSWNKVLNSSKMPRIVVINSFNEYAERTAVWKTQTLHMTDTQINRDDQWIDKSGKVNSDMYWDITVSCISKFKSK